MRASVRLAGVDDIPQIVAMGELFYGASEWARLAPYDPASAAATAGQVIAHGFLLVAEAGGGMVGMLGMYVAPFAMNHAFKTATEVMWWVEPEARTTGAAIKLLRVAKAEAIERGCSWSSMSVLATSPRQAAQLYALMGFRHIESTHLLEL